MNNVMIIEIDIEIAIF